MGQTERNFGNTEIEKSKGTLKNEFLQLQKLVPTKGQTKKERKTATTTTKTNKQQKTGAVENGLEEKE